MLVHLLILLSFGVLTGVTTVLFGFGGGFVTVPVVYALSVATMGPNAMHVAIATSSAVMIVNASMAALAHARTGRLRIRALAPFAGFIAVGALLGAALATLVADGVLHVLFAVYLAISIADILLRRGFVSTADRDQAPAQPSGQAIGATGVGIGAVAAFLGVGGSVLTVPLLRRRGMPMIDAAGSANALSVPVAVAATVVYAMATPSGATTGPLGYVDLFAALALLAGALPTMTLIKRLATDVPDRWHAIAYPLFLALVLLSMLATV